MEINKNMTRAEQIGHVYEYTSKYAIYIGSRVKNESDFVESVIEKTYMEKAVKKIESNDKIGVVYCEADLFGEKTGKWQLPQYSFDKMLLDNIVFVTALFYKKDWESVGGFNTNMEAGMEDYDFWLGILELGKEIYQIPEILFHYRIKPVSRTTGFQSDYIQIQKVYRQI